MTEGFVFLLGLFLGSFLAVLGWRIPRGQSFVWGRSQCDSCRRELSWYELVPVLSWVIQGGRCRRCGAGLSFLYPGSELATGVGLAVLFVHLGPSVAFFLAAAAFSSAIVLSVSDLRYQILPDEVMAVAAVSMAGLVAVLPEPQWAMRLISAVCAAGFFLLLWVITRGRGMGLGDVKLAAFLGFTLGFPGIVIALYSAFLTGAIAGVILILWKRLRLKSKIAFGPFLFLGAAISLLFGDQLLLWWRGLLS